MFLIFLRGREVKIKMFILPQKLIGHFFPFNYFHPKFILNVKTFLGRSGLEAGMKAEEGRPEAVGPSLDSSLLLLSRSDPHNDNLLSRPCLLC